MLVLLAILIFVYYFAAAIFQLSGAERSPIIDFLYIAGFLCATIWWLRSERQRSAVTPVYCHGLLMNVGWFVILPYHLLKTRGAKGLLPLLLLLGSFLLSQIAAVLFYFALGGPGTY